MPLIIVLMVVGKGVALVAGFTAALASHLPRSEIGGIAVAVLPALALVLLACYGAGLLARAAAVGKLR